MNTYDFGFHGERQDGVIDPSRSGAMTRPGVRLVASQQLFTKGEHEIAISHGDAIYSLKITRQGKLVLNK